MQKEDRWPDFTPPLRRDYHAATVADFCTAALTATPEKARDACEDLFKQIVERRLAPPTVVEFAFEQAKEALAATSSRSRFGKPVVLLG